MKNNIFKSLIISSLLFLMMPLLIWAQSSLSLAITPPLMKINMEAGQTWSSYVKIVNDNPETLAAYVQVLDFKSGEEGGVEFIRDNSEEEGNKIYLSRWIEIDKGPYNVPAFQSREISFVINVPKEAGPGGHYAAILVGTKPSENNQKEGTSINIASQISSLILLNVQGDINEQGWIREFATEKNFYQKPQVDFKVAFENTGNVHLQPIGDIKIYNMWDKERGAITVNQKTQFGNVLPESVRTWNFQWKGDESPFEIGRYKAELLLGFGQEARQTVSSTIYFWVVPIVPLAGVLGGFFLFIIFLFFSIKSYINKAIVLAQEESGKLSKKTSLSNIKLTSHMLKAPIKKAIVDLRNSNKEHPKDNIVRVGFLLRRYYKVVMFFLIMIFWGGATIFYLQDILKSEKDFEISQNDESQDQAALLPQDTLKADLSSGQIKATNQSVVAADEEESPQEESAGMPEETIDKQSFSVHLINGCGVAGLASDVSSLLENEGFNIGSLGNADSFNYAETVIKYKEGKEREAEEVAGILNIKASFEEVDGQQEDIIVVIGSDYSL